MGIEYIPFMVPLAGFEPAFLGSFSVFIVAQFDHLLTLPASQYTTGYPLFTSVIVRLYAKPGRKNVVKTLSCLRREKGFDKRCQNVVIN
jgi:hypothetical protein